MQYTMSVSLSEKCLTQIREYTLRVNIVKHSERIGCFENEDPSKTNLCFRNYENEDPFRKLDVYPNMIKWLPY